MGVGGGGGGEGRGGTEDLSSAACACTHVLSCPGWCELSVFPALSLSLRLSLFNLLSLYPPSPSHPLSLIQSCTLYIFFGTFPC